MCRIPRFRKGWSRGRHDIPGDNYNEPLYPPTFVVIIHAGEQSMVTTFVEVYHSPMNKSWGNKGSSAEPGKALPPSPGIAAEDMLLSATYKGSLVLDIPASGSKTLR